MAEFIKSSKKYCRNLFWRMRGAVRKAVMKKKGGKRQLKFQYDPSSYALNFDDGCSCHLRDKAFYLAADDFKLQTSPKNATLIYLIWMES